MPSRGTKTSQTVANIVPLPCALAASAVLRLTSPHGGEVTSSVTRPDRIWTNYLTYTVTPSNPRSYLGVGSHPCVPLRNPVVFLAGVCLRRVPVRGF
jgi:hypothetical protein